MVQESPIKKKAAEVIWTHSIVIPSYISRFIFDELIKREDENRTGLQIIYYYC